MLNTKAPMMDGMTSKHNMYMMSYDGASLCNIHDCVLTAHSNMVRGQEYEFINWGTKAPMMGGMKQNLVSHGGASLYTIYTVTWWPLIETWSDDSCLNSLFEVQRLLWWEVMTSKQNLMMEHHWTIYTSHGDHSLRRGQKTAVLISWLRY